MTSTHRIVLELPSVRDLVVRKSGKLRNETANDILGLVGDSAIFVAL